MEISDTEGDGERRQRLVNGYTHAEPVSTIPDEKTYSTGLAFYYRYTCTQKIYIILAFVLYIYFDNLSQH